MGKYNDGLWVGVRVRSGQECVGKAGGEGGGGSSLQAYPS